MYRSAGFRHRAATATFVVGLTLVLAACGSGTGASGSAAASAGGEGDCDGYPTGEIELVIPYGPGGGFDTWARLLAPALQEELGVNVVPVNREGAGGLVGVTELLSAEPDGSSIAITEPGVLATQQIAGTTDADFSALRAIGRVTVGPETIVVASDSEWQTIEDVQAAADEANPFLMASGGIAAINIVAFDELGLPYTDVPHDSSPDALLSIVRGDTDIAVYPLTSVAEGIAGGDLRPLVVVGDPPAEGAPNADLVAGVPTLDEVTGVDGIGDALAQTRMLVAPPETPDCVIAVLDEAMANVYQNEDFLAQVDEAGLTPIHGSAAEAQEVIDVTFTTLEGYADLLIENLSE